MICKENNYLDNSLDWKYIHENADLNKARDTLFIYSRLFSMRFENIVIMMEEEHFFEALLNLLALIENYLTSKYAIEGEKSFQEIINDSIKNEEDKKILHELRKLRNKMAHSTLIEYYLTFEDDELQYPLNEIGNYKIILDKVFVYCASIFDKYNCLNIHERIKGIQLSKYSFDEIINQYGWSKEDVEKCIQHSIDSEGYSIKIAEKEFLRVLGNSSPSFMYEDLFKSLFKNVNTHLKSL